MTLFPPPQPTTEEIAKAPSLFAVARRNLHREMLSRILFTDEAGIPTNADGGQKSSIAVASGILTRLGEEVGIPRKRLQGQKAGNVFEELITEYVKVTFGQLSHIRPGLWNYEQIGARNQSVLGKFEQYAHLEALARAAAKDPELKAALGNDYSIAPDIVVFRGLESDARLNASKLLVDGNTSNYASIREANGGRPILHASISCKWTMRSDRAQNARSEALNLIRNRKGRLPHVVVVTGEPTISRLTSLALGTGDLDCVYHFALPELVSTVEELGDDQAIDLLAVMIDGKRLKDISDLPLDLAV